MTIHSLNFARAKCLVGITLSQLHKIRGSACALLMVSAAAFPLAALSEEKPPGWVLEARAKSSQLGSQLIAALQEALAEQGPTGGLQVCNLEAPQIAKRLSGKGFDVGRTALRVRNPNNAPDAWEASVLEGFDRRMEDGANPADLEVWKTETTNGKQVGRYMKAIPTGPQCVVCHGNNLAPQLAETIERLYPQDQATGFVPGELRGAFTVIVDLSKQGAP